jgi:hypothetical protein
MCVQLPSGTNVCPVLGARMYVEIPARTNVFAMRGGMFVPIWLYLQCLMVRGGLVGR